MSDLLDNGKTIDSAVIQRGLRELNSDIHFDMGTNLGQWHPYQSTRQGVFWHGVHLCSMDRGQVPEFKQWTVADAVVDVGWDEADKEDVSLSFVSIHPTTPGYADIKRLAQRGIDPALVLRADGTVIQCVPRKKSKVKGKCIRVGWRHTFERLAMAQIPGVTRSTLSIKFGVDMWRFPVGSPDQVSEALVAE